ncbi:phenazine biosynthesis protein PhzF like [Geminocystis sp. NIES-3708]|uniref:PhzF family phenazine biosynthesis protein n=1 Tax=Geminocystis sp. NIES-3708 TaxID=1615909 RepID=UPI0005FC6923|nr:PhzF family phenazine biosynthesis protein [Geminocystis sp. NIES-3708]BAQ59850.1 phenazine biosynthesis protein PhzF like [Geminocystis sp. NIES-3708]
MKFYTLDVFTNQPFSGNQLAVFPHVEELSSQKMAKIAKEFNFSETVFVFPPSNLEANFDVRIFTPAGEIPFAGHPTIGTAFLLAYLGMIHLTGNTTEIILQERIGNVPVTIYCQYNEVVSAELTAPNPPKFFSDIPSKLALAEVLSLSQTDLSDKYTPRAVSCGLPFLIIPVNSLSALNKAQINLISWQKTLSNHIAPHIYPCYQVDEFEWKVRMFAPALNITEDPATGSAATAFAAYLASYQPEINGHWQWLINQGLEINRPSKIIASASKKDNKITEIKVKGESVIITEGILTINNYN